MKLISDELKSLLNSDSGSLLMSDKKNFLILYIKRRAFAVIFTVVVLMLLVTTSIFTDLGFNIGELIYSGVRSFLGF